MSEPKQIIVMRTDLKMRKGKMIAQGAHASMKIFFDAMTRTLIDVHMPQAQGDALLGRINRYEMRLTPIADEWLQGSFTKICVRVDSEEELLKVYEDARQRGFPCALIVDNGRTEFAGVPTTTCCAIGPAPSDELVPVTGHLKLL